MAGVVESSVVAPTIAFGMSYPEIGLRHIQMWCNATKLAGRDVVCSWYLNQCMGAD
jgi:hypothetical protein